MARLTLILIAAMLLMALWATPSRAADRYIMVVDADGAIVPAMENYIDRALDKAEKDDVALVIIQLDTPGGSVLTTEEIIQRIRGAEVPVVVYVGPRGAMAASAGALITMSGHAAAMAPETVIGAASPIDGSGSDLNETADKKAKEILTANMRSLTETRPSEAQAMAVAMITDAEAITATEALELGLIDYIASDIDDLIAQMDGASLPLSASSSPLALNGLQTRTVEMSLIETLLLILTDPTLVYLLLSTGIILIILEFRAPGGWVAGTLGAVMVVLSLYGLGQLPINYLGLIFVGLAVGLFIMEMSIPGTQGGLTVAAAVSLAVGGLIMFNNSAVRQFGGISVIFIVGQTITLAGLGAVVGIWLTRTLKRQPMLGNQGMLGMVGVVRHPLNPQGLVMVNGERWKAETADGLYIDVDIPVRVVKMKNLVLEVEPVDPVEMPNKPKH
ncbi:MAG: nodulation protein NfeD [Anaerolineales bacterium]|nr:nodulation protein NfeD [Anaerolineales bacterium]